MLALEKDLGCFDLIKVETSDLSTTNEPYGILFVWSNLLSQNTCYSALGRAPGFTGDNGAITKWNAPPTWQSI